MSRRELSFLTPLLAMLPAAAVESQSCEQRRQKPRGTHAACTAIVPSSGNVLKYSYGTVDIVWWDFSKEDAEGAFWKAGELMAMVRKNQPAIGHWMKVNGESIYGTDASPFEIPAWGRYTRKPGKLYAHVFQWPEDGKLTIPAKGIRASRAYLLADPNRELRIEQRPDGLMLELPGNPRMPSPRSWRLSVRSTQSPSVEWQTPSRPHHPIKLQGTDDKVKSRDWKNWRGEGNGYEGFLVDRYLSLIAVEDDLKSE